MHSPLPAQHPVTQIVDSAISRRCYPVHGRAARSGGVAGRRGFCDGLARDRPRNLSFATPLMACVLPVWIEDLAAEKTECPEIDSGK
jgi:hypothetical protein